MKRYKHSIRPMVGMRNQNSHLQHKSDGGINFGRSNSGLKLLPYPTGRAWLLTILLHNKVESYTLPRVAALETWNQTFEATGTMALINNQLPANKTGAPVAKCNN